MSICSPHGSTASIDAGTATAVATEPAAAATLAAGAAPWWRFDVEKGSRSTRRRHYSAPEVGCEAEVHFHSAPEVFPGAVQNRRDDDSIHWGLCAPLPMAIR